MVEQIRSPGYGGLPFSALTDQRNGALPAPLSTVCEVVTDQLVLYQPLLDSLGDMLPACVEKFHRQSPTRRGAPLAHCRASLPRNVADATFRFLLRTLSSNRRIVAAAGLVCSFGYNPLEQLSNHDRTLAAAIESDFNGVA